MSSSELGDHADHAIKFVIIVTQSERVYPIKWIQFWPATSIYLNRLLGQPHAPEDDAVRDVPTSSGRPSEPPRSLGSRVGGPNRRFGALRRLSAGEGEVCAALKPTKR